MLLLYEINEHILYKENELDLHRKQQSIGLYINNFVNAFNYNILLVKEKCGLFISYIEFFHSLHTKYLQRFAMKVNLMYTQITHDVRFEDTPTASDKNKKELLHNFKSDNIDKTLIKEIKRSFDDSDSNSSSAEIPEKFEPELNIIIPKSSGASSYLNVKRNSKCKEKIDIGSDTTNNGTYTGMFKNNVKKMILGMNLFKKKQKDDTYSLVFSETPLNTPIKEPIHDSLITETSNSEDINIKTDGDKNNFFDKCHKTSSAEEMFIEISKECDELTVSLSCRPEFSNSGLLGMTYVGDENIVQSSIIQKPFS
jgi:hypothetical protein